MSMDPVERLRRANPVPGTPAAPPIEPLLARLQGRPQPDSVEHPADAGAGRPHRVLHTVPVAFAVLGTIVIAVLALALLRHGHHATSVSTSPGLHVAGGLPPVPSLGPADMRAIDWHWRTRPHVVPHGQACAAFAPGAPRSGASEGSSPGRALLDDYAVTRSPVTAANALPAGQRSGPWSAYGRVAQRKDGITIDVIPQPFDQPLGAPPTAGCENAKLAALRKDMAGAPPVLIARALRITREIFEDERYTQKHPDGICVTIGFGICGSFINAQARGELATSPHGAHGSINADLVPDGVARVTVHYAAQRRGAPTGQQVSALTITVPVINNVAVWNVANRGSTTRPQAVTWLTNAGRPIRTTYP